MKNDFEMYQSVLSRRTEHIKKKERQKRIIMHTVPVIACLCLTVGLGLGYWNYSRNIPSIPSSPDIIIEVPTTAAESTSQVPTVRTSSKTTVSATKTAKTTVTGTSKTEKETTSAVKTSTNTETTEANTTETTAAPVTEPPTQQTSVIETSVNVTMTTQSSANTTLTTHDDAHITTSVITTSGGNNMGGVFSKVYIDGVTYYYIGTDDSGDDGKNEYTLDEFLGYGTDFEGIFHDNPTVKFYTILESDDIVVAIKKGEQIPFTRKLPFKESKK
ncbi:MAG: tyrosinase family protein [Ruminococcus sp.]|uniref:tyrosinase family protein n=1 Tax=Ruminococcus sp. TaxID=41978 RepID=UPI0025F8F540|nr:tyrosinase family protein [Ruminococcus sp.]MBR5683108.1 tyrosinase family protein [Ruminococcus sp.]